MGHSSQPFLYEAASHSNAGSLPQTSFDPKAVTRASWAPKPTRERPDGPLVSFNRHPDYHNVVGQRTPFKPLGPRTKSWMIGLRRVQLALRVIELICAGGILTIMIMLMDVDQLTSWIMRVSALVAMLHCGYAIYHLSRPARSRPPASSAAYQIFASISDLCILPLYAFGMLAVRNQSSTWTTSLTSTNAMKYQITCLYYGLVGAGGLHLISLTIGLWLASKFRQITRMPPDMNPLEDHLTARPSHKRNKSSVVSTWSEKESNVSSGIQEYRRGAALPQGMSRPPSVPFMATRARSNSPRSSIISNATAGPDHPSRQYQVAPGNSPRNSATPSDLSRMSAARESYTPSSPWRSSNVPSVSNYTELPRYEDRSTFNVSANTVSSSTTTSSNQPQQSRAPKFTEAWYATDSLVSRTNDRKRALEALGATRKTQNYQALGQQYDNNDDDSEDENHDLKPDMDEIYDENSGDLSQSRYGTPTKANAKHPNPLRSNPSRSALKSGGNVVDSGSSPLPKAQRPKSMFAQPHHHPALTEIDLNDRRVSGSADITDATAPELGRMKNNKNNNNHSNSPRVRNSSIQPEGDFFYSKPYGELKCATPPIIIGGSGSGSGDRQVSSGNDYAEAGNQARKSRFTSFGKRNVSGKIAEEGRAGENRWSR